MIDRHTNAYRVTVVARTARIRLQVLSHYANGALRCACCAEPDNRLLTLDHIDGKRPAGQPPIRGNLLCQWLRMKGYPAGFRVLCYNCNTSIGYHGYCPHQTAPIFRQYASKWSMNEHYRQQAMRLVALAYYSGFTGRCVCCGERHVEFLSLDHVLGGGKRHHENVVGKNNSMYQWLKRAGYPAGFRTLCMNCNAASAQHGGCHDY